MIRAVAEPSQQQSQQQQNQPQQSQQAATATAQNKRPPRTKRVWSWRRAVVAVSATGLFGLAVCAFFPCTRWVDASGYLVTDLEVELRPSVEGAIAEWKVRSGDKVAADQLIIQLNNSVQKADYEHALSQLDAKKAELEQLLSAQELARAQRKEQISRAEQNLKLAKDYYERMRVGEGFSPKEVEEAQLKAEIAASTLAELRLPRDTVWDNEVAVAKEQVEMAQRSATAHEAQLRLREIRSPMNGLVQLNRYEPGEVVKPEHVLGQVFDRSKWVVKLKVPERAIPHVKLGQPVEVELAAYSTWRYGYMKGKVTQIIPVVSPQQQPGTSSFYIEATLDEPWSDVTIQPGMTATAYVDTGRTTVLQNILGW